MTSRLRARNLPDVHTEATHSRSGNNRCPRVRPGCSAAARLIARIPQRVMKGSTRKTVCSICAVTALRMRGSMRS